MGAGASLQEDVPTGWHALAAMAEAADKPDLVARSRRTASTSWSVMASRNAESTVALGSSILLSVLRVRSFAGARVSLAFVTA